MTVATLLHATAKRLRRVGTPPREAPFVAQRTAGDCGAACLTMVLGLHGRHLDRTEMHSLLADGAACQSALALLQAAEAHGLTGRGLQLSADSVPELRPGSILHVDGNHFVVFARAVGERIVVLDPARGRSTMRMSELRQRFTGIALELWPGAGFTRRARTRPRLTHYLAPLLRHRTALGRALSLSAVLVALSLSVPIATRVIIDDLLPTPTTGWLPIFVAAGLGIACMQSLVSITRSLSLIQLRELVDRKLMGDVVGRLMALPFSFFQRRSVGDLVMRLGSVGHIREVLTGSTLSAGVDGCLVLLYLAILIWFSPIIAATAAVLACLQLALFAASRKRLHDDAAHYLASEAELRGFQTRMLMGIETLKAGGMVAEATARLDRVFEGVLASARTRGRHTAWIEGVAAGLRVLSPLAILGVGAFTVLAGDISLGTMLAAGQLAAAFLVPAISLVQTAGSIQVLRGHVERLEEIWTNPPEASGDHVPTDIGAIEIRDLTFAHGPSHPPCLSGLSLDVAPRQHIAIVGPSGSGKSTLARVLLGLLQPQAGTISYGGVPLERCSLEHLRRLTGIVTQEATLFDMTIADNIRLGRADATFEDVTHAAELAGIHDEILAMPMGYDTLVSDGGSSLSGGQRQRITLARALVRKPRILVLDEATSALDALGEQGIHREIRRLDCTVITIAHRLSTVVGADVIHVLVAGRIVESGTHDELVERGGYYPTLLQAQLTPTTSDRRTTPQSPARLEAPSRDARNRGRTMTTNTETLADRSPTNRARIAHWAELAARVALGAVFLAAAWYKATDYESFARDLYIGYRLPGTVMPFAFFLPTVEVALGLALVLGFHARKAARLATFALAAFSFAILFGMFRGELQTCGCGGRLLDVGPTLALVRNGILAAAAIWIGWRRPAGTSRWGRAKPWTIAIAACIAASLTGISSHTPLVDRTTLRVGDPFPAELLADQGIDITRGRWVVFGFSATCLHCWDATHEIESLVASPDVSVVGITASEPAQLEAYRAALKPGFAIAHVEQTTFDELQRELPTSWLVENGIVRDKREGRAYSAPALSVQFYGAPSPQ